MSDPIDLTVPKGQNLVLQQPRYRCAIHGDIGQEALVSIIAGHEMVLCLRCYLEKLKEIGVREVEQIS